jgi:octaprenyl-diphosphate synthase
MLKTTTPLQAIRKLVHADFDAVNQLIQTQLSSNLGLVQDVTEHIISGGGKRLRPLMVLLSAKALGYQGQQHIDVATIIEFIHTATLLHDDVVDASNLRRGAKTANFIWGNEASILVGDYMYSLAFKMMANLQKMRVMEILADATHQIAAGEVIQLMNRNNPDLSEAHYLEVIKLKTAKLFEAATQLSSIIAESSQQQEIAITNYGLHFGVAYQLIDDILDYSATSPEWGKNIGNDLAEGKATLPLIYTMQHGTPAQIKLVRDAIINGSSTEIDSILKAISASDALSYAKKLAKQQTEIAIKNLKILPASPYQDALQTLAEFNLERSS